MPVKAAEPDDDYHEEAPDWWLGKPRPDERVISYNLRKGERPGGMKVRFKIRVETGRKAAALNAQQAEAIRELLQWASQHHKPQAR